MYDLNFNEYKICFIFQANVIDTKNSNTSDQGHQINSDHKQVYSLFTYLYLRFSRVYIKKKIRFSDILRVVYYFKTIYC